VRDDAADPGSGFDAVQSRHQEIDDYNVRPQFSGFIDGFVAILRLTADVKALVCEHRQKNASRSLMIVYQ